jgi:hypothetical protein
MSADDVKPNQMELEPAPTAYAPPALDRRRHMPEPPPVRLTAIEDVLLETIDGLDKQLDEFYVAMLQFERDANERDRIVYRAENFRLLFDIRQRPIERPDMRPVGVEVRSLLDAEMKIIARELEYQRFKGLTAGSEQLMLQDPAGNWVSITERRGVR